MPTCRDCGVTQATVEMTRGRKSFKGTWICKDKDACKTRRVAARANAIANKKGVK